MIHHDKYPLRQYLVDKPDPDPRRILQLISHQQCQLRNPEFKDQQSIVLYRNRKGGTARVVHCDLVATLGKEATAYGTVTEYLRAAHISPGNPAKGWDPASARTDDSDEAILKLVEELSLSLVRKLSRAIHLPVTMVYRWLSEKIGLPARHLGWVPHILSEDQEAMRVESSRFLLTILWAQHTRDW